ncbi:hypothetical protein MJG53_005622 [Ovis ammon polii x Ovis aries]|uniref:Uncharacterized protein n=1 Tax=Ovis ammon polii x Ovis aries TaxID=2918886 RepID=A0ACB9V6M8_9CETA|nr:hypothetical protein MJG53_005622 [Ovis ammon polii x Ovis aries]
MAPPDRTGRAQTPPPGAVLQPTAWVALCWTVFPQRRAHSVGTFQGAVSETQDPHGNGPLVFPAATVASLPLLSREGTWCARRLGVGADLSDQSSAVVLGEPRKGTLSGHLPSRGPAGSSNPQAPAPFSRVLRRPGSDFPPALGSQLRQRTDGLAVKRVLTTPEGQREGERKGLTGSPAPGLQDAAFELGENQNRGVLVGGPSVRWREEGSDPSVPRELEGGLPDQASAARVRVAAPPDSPWEGGLLRTPGRGQNAGPEGTAIRSQLPTGLAAQKAQSAQLGQRPALREHPGPRGAWKNVGNPERTFQKSDILEESTRAQSYSRLQQGLRRPCLSPTSMEACPSLNTR